LVLGNLAAGEQAVADTNPAPAVKLTQVYPVADLVIPIQDAVPDRVPKHTQEDALMDVIRQTVAPGSWRVRGGEGTIAYFPIGMALVVHQTPEVQQQVAELLNGLRRLQDVEVAVELRIVTVGERAMEKISAEFPLPSGKPCYLNDGDVKRLLESAQQDRTASIMQAPKITVFNGQRAQVRVTDTGFFLTGMQAKPNAAHLGPVETGVKFEVQPVVSADRRTVTLRLKGGVFDVERPVPAVPVTVPITAVDGTEVGCGGLRVVQQPQVTQLTVDRVLKADAGQTAVLIAGTKHVEQRQEVGHCPQVLSRIPYLNRLFRNVGYVRETQTVLFLATTRVVVNEDETFDCRAK
jgi:Flp pilus assembly secretin CpaC